MRWFILLVTLGLLGSQDTEANRSQERVTAAIAKIESLGGHVERSSKLPGSPVVKVFLPGNRAKNANLELLQAFPELRNFECRCLCKNPQQHLTDEGLRHLYKLNKIECISLSGCGWVGITDAAVRELQAALPKAKIEASLSHQKK